MCQVSSGEFCLVDPYVDLFVDFVEGGLEGCIGGAEVGKRGGQSRTQQSVVGAGKEQRCAQAELGDAIAEAVRQALDQAVQGTSASSIRWRKIKWMRSWCLTRASTSPIVSRSSNW